MEHISTTIAAFPTALAAGSANAAAIVPATVDFPNMLLVLPINLF